MAEQDETADTGKWVAIIVGLVMAVPVSAILANQAPLALIALIVVGFLAWAGVRSGVLDREAADDADARADPVATLQERYAAGELSEAEFERRLDRLLDSDRRAAAEEGVASTAGERERATDLE